MARARSQNLTRLLKIFTESQEQFVEILEALLLNKSKRQRDILRIRAVKLIRRLRAFSEDWLEKTLTTGIARYDREALAALKALGLNIEDRSNDTILGVRSIFLGQTRRYFDNVTGSMFTLLASITAVRAETLAVAFPDITAKVQGRDPLLSDPFFSVERDAEILDTLKERIRTKQVNLPFGNRSLSYSMQYYGTLIGHTVESSIETAVHMARAREFGWDLLQINADASLTGDFCNAYRNRVVSLQGSTDGYVMLARLPSSGPPFHPWCRHSLQIFDPDSVTANQLTELRFIPEDMLLSGPEDDFTRIQKAWKSKR